MQARCDDPRARVGGGAGDRGRLPLRPPRPRRPAPVARAVLAGTLALVFAASPAAAWRADRYEAEAERLEALVGRDHARAVAQAAALLRELDAALEAQGAEDAASQEQAEAYRGLAASAREAAEAHRARAARWRREAEDSRWAAGQGAEFREYAAEEEARADEELARARDLERRAAGAGPRSPDEEERLRGARARLAAVAATPPPPPPEPEPALDDGPRPDRGPPGLTVQDALGVWREAQDGWLVALLPKDPGVDSLSHRLLAYTDERVWEGRYTSFNAGDPRRPQSARMVFTYRPEADEMDAAIPRWAREAVAGELTWVAELEEEGACGDPRLRGRWYPGEVTWEEGSDGAPGRAWVSGPGTASRFALEPEDSVEVESFGRAALWLRLDASHDARQHPIRALTKLQRFRVDVTMPVAMAEARGSRLRVDVVADGGSSTTLELERRAGPDRGLASYGLSRAVTVADPWEQGVVDVHPSFLSWDYVTGALGARLDLQVDDGEVVRFRYDGAERAVPVYDTWRTRGVARYREAADELSEIFARVTRTDADPAVKEEAHTRRRMLANLRVILANLEAGSSSDLLPYRIAAAYVAPDHGLATMTPSRRLELTGQNVTVAGRAANTVAPLSAAERNGANDPTGPWDGVVWTSRLEKEMAAATLAQAQAEVLTALRGEIDEAMAFALYDTLLAMTGAGDLYTLVFQETPHGRPATTAQVVLAALGLASNFGARPATEALLTRVMEPHAFPAQTLPPPPRPIGAGRRSGGAPGAEAATGRAARGSGAAAPELPRSLPPERRSALAERRRLGDRADASEPVPCRRAGPPRAPAPLPRPRPVPDLDTADLATLRAWYGERARFADPTGARLRPKQIGSSCNCASLGPAIREATGVDLSDIAMMRILVNNGFVNTKVWNPFERGYLHSAASALVELMGAETASTARGTRLTLLEMDRRMREGWRIKDVVRTLDVDEKHAVLIRRFERHPDGGLSQVVFFDPAFGREVQLPVCDFMQVALPDQQLLFRWTGGAGAARPSIERPSGGGG